VVISDRVTVDRKAITLIILALHLPKGCPWTIDIYIPKRFSAISSDATSLGGKSMAGPWETELDSAMRDKRIKLGEVVNRLRKRQDERDGKVKEIKLALTTNLGYIIKVLKKDPFIGADEFPKVSESEDGLSVELLMPLLKEVHQVDLLFEITIYREQVCVKAFRHFPNEVKEEMARAFDSFDSFVKNRLTEFIPDWYNRKIGNELDKEREEEFELRFVVSAMDKKKKDEPVVEGSPKAP